MKRPSKNQIILGSAILGIISFVSIAALTGIIGNRADALFLFMLGIIPSTSIEVQFWLPFLQLLFLIGLVISGIILYVKLKREVKKLTQERDLVKANYETVKEVWEKLINLDKWLEISLLELVNANSKGREKILKRTLEKFLRDLTSIFPNSVSTRATILCPDLLPYRIKSPRQGGE
jgi:hypothetical protein